MHIEILHHAKKKGGSMLNGLCKSLCAQENASKIKLRYVLLNRELKESRIIGLYS